MKELEKILLDEMISIDSIGIMLECCNDDSIDCFISDRKAEEYKNEICPKCGKKFEDCDCDDDEELYYDKDELNREELDEIDDDKYNC